MSARLTSLALAVFLQTAPAVPAQAPGSAVDPAEKGSIADHVSSLLRMLETRDATPDPHGEWHEHHGMGLLCRTRPDV